MRDSGYSLNDKDTEDVRKFVPKEYNMSVLSEMDKIEEEQRESSHTSENFQTLLLELFSKENSDSVVSTATLGSLVISSPRNERLKTLGREELLG